jgi:hypothetical protein
MRPWDTFVNVPMTTLTNTDPLLHNHCTRQGLLVKGRNEQEGIRYLQAHLPCFDIDRHRQREAHLYMDARLCKAIEREITYNIDLQ